MLLKATLLICFGLVSTVTHAEVVTARCKGTQGKFSYDLMIFASSDEEGGFRVTESYDSAFPTESTEIGITTATGIEGDNLVLKLTPKAYEIGAYNIPHFYKDGEPTAIKTASVDLTGGKARYQGVNLSCR